MTAAQPRVMVVEDDDAIREGLCDALRFGGYQPLTCARGDRAVREILETGPDVVLLDVMLPGKNGFEILREVRAAKPTLPIVMVTARGDERDRVDGLNRGADDYVVKPFSAREVLARIGAVLRRSAERPADVGVISFDGATVSLARCEAARGGKTATLTTRDVDVLRLLSANRDRTIARDEFLRVVWGVDPRGADTRAVDMQFVRLRESLAVVGISELIETVRGKGYRLAPTARVEA